MVMRSHARSAADAVASRYPSVITRRFLRVATSAFVRIFVDIAVIISSFLFSVDDTMRFSLALSALSLVACVEGFVPLSGFVRSNGARSMGISDELDIPCAEDCAMDSYPNMPASVHPGVLSGQAMLDLLDHAKENGTLTSFLRRMWMRVCGSVLFRSECEMLSAGKPLDCFVLGSRRKKGVSC